MRIYIVEKAIKIISRVGLKKALFLTITNMTFPTNTPLDAKKKSSLARRVVSFNRRNFRNVKKIVKF